MANEINIAQDTGLTLTAKVYTVAGVQQGSTVNLTEVATGLYSGNFSLTGVSDGRYAVLFFNSAVVVGFGNLYVIDELEVDFHKLETRLQSIAEHDATQATLANKLDAIDYTAPDNASITAIKAKTDNLPSDPADQSLIEAAISAIPSAPSAASIADEVRVELAPELALIDVATSTRSTPTNVTDAVTSIKGADNKDLTQVFDNSPTIDLTPVTDAIAALNDLSLAEIEASTVLAKEATVAAKLDASAYVAPDNAGIADLVANQGNWATATGFSTPSDIDAAVVDLKGTDDKDLSQVATELDLVKTQSTLARKHLTNRDKIDKTAKTLIRYDDDGTTPLLTFDLKNSNGDASADSIFEKVPQ